VRAQDDGSSLSKRGLSGGDLEEDVDTVTVVLNHAGNPFHLPGDSTQAGDHGLLELGCHHGGTRIPPRGIPG
jgi:hypothetical protein